MAPIPVAVLDDYQSVHTPHFDPLVSQGLISVTALPTTLPSFNHPATPASVQQELISRLTPYTIISTMRERTPFPSALLRSLPNLRLLLTTGPRNASIDLAAASELGIVVCGTTGLGRSDTTAVPDEEEKAALLEGPDSTTQHTWALILGLVRGVAVDDRSVKSGAWQHPTFLPLGLPGKTLGVIGLGRIGATVARIGALAFGMKVLAWSTSLTQAAADEKALSKGLPSGTFVVASSKEEVFRNADVVTVHYVLSDRSRGLVGRTELQAMKEGAFFVNTSRGPVVDEDALLEVLEKGAIAGAALDVFGVEPLEGGSRWRTTKWGEEGRARVLLTPHTGYVEQRVMRNWYAETAENVQRWIGGEELRTRLN